MNASTSDDWEPKKESQSSGVHSRGYLPHVDYPGLVQSIVFRLHDSVPRTVIELWQRELECNNQLLERRKWIERLERYLNQGIGKCWLAIPSVARLVEATLLHFNNNRYDILAWCIMPNHVHVLMCPRDGQSVSSILHSWKSYTAHAANKQLGRRGPFWFCDYFDEFMKSPGQLEATIRYIELNPVTAKLVNSVEDWPYSSAKISCVDPIRVVRDRFRDIHQDLLPDL